MTINKDTESSQKHKRDREAMAAAWSATILPLLQARKGGENVKVKMWDMNATHPEDVLKEADQRRKV